MLTSKYETRPESWSKYETNPRPSWSKYETKPETSRVEPDWRFINIKKLESMAKEDDKSRERIAYKQLQVLENRNSREETPQSSAKVEEVAVLNKSNAVLKKENKILREQLQKYQAEKEQAKIETDRYKITNGALIEQNTRLVKLQLLEQK